MHNGPLLGTPKSKFSRKELKTTVRDPGRLARTEIQLFSSAALLIKLPQIKNWAFKSKNSVFRFESSENHKHCPYGHSVVNPLWGGHWPFQCTFTEVLPQFLLVPSASSVPFPGQQRPPPHRLLEAVQAEGVLCGGVSEDHVRVVEHVQAVQRQRVDLQVVQGELGVHVEADVRGQGAREVLGQAGGGLSTDCREAERPTGALETAGDRCLSERDSLQGPTRSPSVNLGDRRLTGPAYHRPATRCGLFGIPTP